VLNQAAGQGGLHATSVLNFALEILDPRDLHFVHLVQTRAKATTDGVTLDANVEYLKATKNIFNISFLKKKNFFFFG